MTGSGRRLFSWQFTVGSLQFTVGNKQLADYSLQLPIMVVVVCNSAKSVG